jgi:hypothetical protein
LKTQRCAVTIAALMRLVQDRRIETVVDEYERKILVISD